MIKRSLIIAGQRFPALANPLWRAIYPLIRGDELYAGDEYGDDRQQVFEDIYRDNLWHSEESRSGDGSSASQTRYLTHRLPPLLDALGATTLLDAPCGDFHWMRHVALGPSVSYTGADLVRPLVADLDARFGGPNRRFIILDIVTDPLPACDVWLCRDVLFHLPNADVAGLLRRIDPDNCTWFLSTTYPWVKVNRDIRAGGFRFINLERPPFSLPPPERTIDDFAIPEPPRVLGLWRVADIANAVATRRL